MRFKYGIEFGQVGLPYLAQLASEHLVSDAELVHKAVTALNLTWGHSNKTGKRLQELHQINKLASKMLAPVRHTTPRKSLEIIYDLIPLDLQGEYEAITALTRQETILRQTWIGQNPKHTSYTGHRRYWFDLKNDLVGRHVLMDMQKGRIPEQKYIANMESLKTETLPIQSQINIYTDGSMTCNHVGAGFVIYENNTEINSKSIRLSYNTTVFQAEVIAIREAIKAFKTIKKPHQQYIKIMTDSQAALLALHSYDYTSLIVHSAMEELNSLARQ